MTLHISILGIDGSGKSTIASTLPYILAAELKLRAGSAGENFCVVECDEDLLAPKFYPNGLPLSGHVSKWLKRKAKSVVDNRRLYPFFKLSQMVFQDSATYKIGRRYKADLMVSDGNLLLSATGRAANYLRPASDKANLGAQAPESSDLKAVFEYLLDKKPLPEESQNKLPRLEKAKMIQHLTRLLGLQAVWLPDIVIFLDLSPEIAIKRIASRSKKIDRHENVDDLAQARRMYLKTVDAFRKYRSPEAAHIISVDRLTPGETLQAVVTAIKPRISIYQSQKMVNKVVLGTTTVNLASGTVWRRIFNYGYLVRYLMGKFFQGAWREPTFLVSNLGRLFLKEGYSAGIMRAIYDQDYKPYGFWDHIFLGYPLHRAVYDRLQILTKKIETKLEKRLEGDQDVNIFTAPSGYAYDLFKPLNSIAARRPEAMARLRLTASDLDPAGNLAEELARRAENLGIRFKFLRGDITDDKMRQRFEAEAPYDLALFVGLSAWLPKAQIIHHLKWVCKNLRETGVLVSDSFTPEAYALSGRYMGYKANYYTPDVYKTLIDYCGFDGLRASVESGFHKINHVMLFSPKKHIPARQP